MLIRFTDDYINEIFAAYSMVGQIQEFISQKEPFVGNSPVLDELYSMTVLMSGIADHLSNDDNSEPKENEAFLMCLRSLINKAEFMCKCKPRPLIDRRMLHQTSQ